MQVRRVQRIAEDALPRHVVESLMQEPAEGMLGDFESPPHSHCLKLLSDYENLVQQQQESNLQRLQYLHHDSGHLSGSHHKLQHHRGGHAQHADYAEAAAAAAALQGLSGGFACASPAWHQGEDLYSSPSRCYDWQQQHGQQQQMTLPNVQEELQGGWFETRLPCHHSLTDLKAAAQKSPMRSATRSPCASVLAVVGQQGDAGQGGWRSSGSGPSLRSSGESSTPYYPTTARLSLTGSSGPLAPLPLPRVSVGSASSQSYPGSAHRCSDMADTTYAEHHPDACVLFAGEADKQYSRAQCRACNSATTWCRARAAA